MPAGTAMRLASRIPLRGPAVGNSLLTSHSGGGTSHGEQLTDMPLVIDRSNTGAGSGSPAPYQPAHMDGRSPIGSLGLIPASPVR